MKATMTLQVIAQDVRAGNIWPEETFRRGYEEQDDAGLQDLIAAQQGAIEILFSQPSSDAEAILAEIRRRMGIAAASLAGRRSG